MIIFRGKSAVKGIALGKLYVYQKHVNQMIRKTNCDAQEEIQRYNAAKKQAGEELKNLYEQAKVEAGENHAVIFAAHQLILEDDEFNRSICREISENGMNAEYAVELVRDRYAKTFRELPDEYMRERGADIDDVARRIQGILIGKQEEDFSSEEPVILLAKNLTPSETICMDKKKIMSFVTTEGTVNSHTAILARAMNVPTIVNTRMEQIEQYHGKNAVVDGTNGMLIIEPEEDFLQTIQNRIKDNLEEQKHLQSLIGQENQTKDGRCIAIYANIGSPEEAEAAISADAGGIGLFRSEFLYLGRENAPDEEEQFAAYQKAVTLMKNKHVIIRTLDIGADKQVDYLGLGKEDNPAMGYRAIRICLKQTQLFRTQLRAIYRAATYGKVSIMFPMIVSVKEVRQIKEICTQVREELKKENIPFGEARLGIMIETPSAAVLSDELAKEVDFFSIGTNDLTQYTLAVDRQNPNLENLFEENKEAVLRLIRLTVENAHQAGIPVGICGEMAGDTTLTEEFLKMGVDELSVAPGTVLRVRARVREI